jgi:hypothetical protein
VKSLARVVGALIAVAGLTLIVVPVIVPWLALHPLTLFELFASAIIRIAIGILFISAARTARIPWLLQLLGGIAIVAGVATLFIGVDRARAIAEWMSQQGVGVVRVFGLLPLLLGVLVIYACGPVRRAV